VEKRTLEAMASRIVGAPFSRNRKASKRRRRQPSDPANGGAAERVGETTCYNQWLHLYAVFNQVFTPSR
ncbi:hypothetical protein, partial [Mesorhizobium sp. M1C.F.Ca.ET.195.01.1.1]|uniref:hypothetical protein n=1 Tax=Mesorhizobium sp. M1C.F.Ca.ET.195.01.1.1 TaxID=2563927 RepID=UPI001AEDBD54